MTTPLTSYRLPSTRTDLPVVPICRRRPRLPEAPETLHVRPVPRLSRGALRDRHERWVRDAMDARARRTNAPRSRTAKSCGSGVPTLTPSWQRCFCIVACDGGNQARSPGRARSKPLKPFARGKPDWSGRTCGDFARVLFVFAHEAAGVYRHPAFPAPSNSGVNDLKARTRQGREIADA